MGIIFGWIVFSFVAGFIGSSRNIGFFGAFILALIFSPLVGIIVALVSKNTSDEEYKQAMLKSLNKVTSTKSVKKDSIVDELEKLQKMKSDGIITDEEFITFKNKLIN